MAKTDTYVRLTEAGQRAVFIRDPDEIALYLSEILHCSKGRWLYLDELASVPQEAYRWMLDRRNQPLIGEEPNPELLKLLADWPPGGRAGELTLNDIDHTDI